MNQTETHSLELASVYKTAWSLLNGSKGPIWSVASLILLISVSLELLSSHFLGAGWQRSHYLARYIALPILSHALIAPFYAGALMVAIRRTRSEPVDTKTGLSYLSYWLPLTLAMILIGLFSELPAMILNIPPIAHSLGSALHYVDLLSLVFSLLVYTFFVLSIPMIIDKKYTIGQALFASPMLIKPHWYRVFLIYVLLYFCMFLFMLPAFAGLALNNASLMLFGGIFFLVALIWLLPFTFLLSGVIYHRLVDPKNPLSSAQQ